MNNFEQIKTYMPFSDPQKPLIAQGWLRVLIFVATYFCLLIILGQIIRMIFPEAFAAGNDKKNVNFLFLMFFTSSAIAIAWVWLFRKFVDRKTFESLGFDWAANTSHAGAGFFLGILMLCVGTLILVLTKNLRWTDLSFNGTSVFLSFGLMLIIAFAEEIVFRGYVLNNLLESTGKWMALVISSLLFAGFHMGNSSVAVLPIVNIFLASLLLGVNYIYTKNLWFSIALHFSWNFVQGAVLGYAVSGLPIQSIFHHELKGDDIITGGDFGFEGSILTGILSLIVLVVLVYLYEGNPFAKGKIKSVSNRS